MLKNRRAKLLLRSFDDAADLIENRAVMSLQRVSRKVVVVVLEEELFVLLLESIYQGRLFLSRLVKL